MKRTIFSVMLALLLSLCLCGLALAAEPGESAAPAEAAEPMLISEPAEGEAAEGAEEAEGSEEVVESLPLEYVTDDAFILTDDALYDLNKRARKATVKLDYGIYIITVKNYTHLELEAGEMADLTECAAAIYKEYDLGYGEEKNGLLLMISVDTQEYALVDYGNINFSEQNKALLADTFIPAFSAESWYDGFRAYLEGVTQVVPAAKEGIDLDEVELHPDGEDPAEEDADAEANAEAKDEEEPSNVLLYVGIAAVLVIVLVILLLGSKKKKQAAKAPAKKAKKK